MSYITVPVTRGNWCTFSCGVDGMVRGGGAIGVDVLVDSMEAGNLDLLDSGYTQDTYQGG